MDTSSLQRIIDNPRLPTLPVIAIKIIDLSRREDTAPRRLAEAISMDPALTLARILMEESPVEALVARYGGEEFAIVLPGMDCATASDLAECLRQRFQKVSIDTDRNQPLFVTASFGVSTWDGDDVRCTPAEFLKSADQALYAA